MRSGDLCHPGRGVASKGNATPAGGPGRRLLERAGTVTGPLLHSHFGAKLAVMVWFAWMSVNV